MANPNEPINRRQFIGLAATMVAGTALSDLKAGETKSVTQARPNIIFITTHDTGRHFGCYGEKTVNSPAIDSLSVNGVRFTNAFCAAPKCSPSRAAMMTGRYPQSNGVMGLTHSPYWWKYKTDERHMASLLREAGYRTHLFHFQHETENAMSLGFDEWHARPTPYAHDVMPDPYCHRPAAEVAEAFETFCAAHPAGPFYAQIGLFETHNPLDFGGNKGDDSLGVKVPPYWEDKPKMRAFFNNLQGAIRQVDEAVGRIMEALRKNGLEENTLVVFTVDHGLSLSRAKGTCYEKGLEVALLMSWPRGGVSGGRASDQLISNVDVLPTVLELAGVPVPKNVEGISFANTAQGKKGDAIRSSVFGLYEETRSIRSVRTERYKLIRNFSHAYRQSVPVDMEQKEFQAVPFVELYDLQEDPFESRNLADNPAAVTILMQLDAVLLNHLRQVHDPILEGPVPTPFYLLSMENLKAAEKRK